MNLSITKEQRIFVLKHWWSSRKTYEVVTTNFENEFPNEKVPSRQAIYQLAKKFDETGSVDDAPRSGRPTTTRSFFHDFQHVWFFPVLSRRKWAMTTLLSAVKNSAHSYEP